MTTNEIMVTWDSCTGKPHAWLVGATYPGKAPHGGWDGTGQTAFTTETLPHCTICALSKSLLTLQDQSLHLD